MSLVGKCLKNNWFDAKGAANLWYNATMKTYPSTAPKHWTNNIIVNLMLPTALFVGMIACCVMYVVGEMNGHKNTGLLFAALAFGISFKFIHNWLERVSCELREK